MVIRPQLAVLRCNRRRADGCNELQPQPRQGPGPAGHAVHELLDVLPSKTSHQIFGPQAATNGAWPCSSPSSWPAASDVPATHIHRNLSTNTKKNVHRQTWLPLIQISLVAPNEPLVVLLAIRHGGHRIDRSAARAPWHPTGLRAGDGRASNESTPSIDQKHPRHPRL
jgi:hypothetical protein